MDIFTHIRIVLGMIIGLGIARLLLGLTRFIQHPDRYKPSLIHLIWASSTFLLLVHFWWWEFRLHAILGWTFSLYFFLIIFAILLFSLCTLLFPDDINEYEGYEDYFLSRRVWFFAILASTFAFDYLDTLIKGRDYAELFGLEYEIRLPVYLLLCTIAAVTRSRRFHLPFAVASFVYQVSWILRLFETLD
ncbi:hypothetical protein BH10PSE7_BH10PSE7_15010 [soil metagenome]